MWIRRSSTFVGAAACLLLALVPVANAATTERVNVGSDGTEANGDSDDGLSVSADGRFVAFQSNATNLVPGNGAGVYVHDRQIGTTEFIAPGRRPAISDDGRFVAFVSAAEALVPGDTNPLGEFHIFVHDRTTGTNELVDVSSDGAKGAGTAGGTAISANGRYVTFSSSASNLVPGDLNARFDTFVRDRTAATTERVSVSNSGGELNAGGGDGDVSDDGRYVSFASLDSNAVSGDENGAYDVFVRDRGAETTEIVSVSSAGTRSDGDSFVDAGPQSTLTSDGRLVVFRSEASTLGGDGRAGGVFVRDLQSGETTRITTFTDPRAGTISAGGRVVAFRSASAIVSGDTNGADDVFLYDRETGAIERLSVSTAGDGANGASESPQVSAAGQDVVFSSIATNLVAGDTDACTQIIQDRGEVIGTEPRNCRDVFVRDLGPVATNGASAELPESGGTVSTNSEVTPDDPVGTSVTSPVGGQVTISETTQTDPAPSGYAILGQQVNIEAPVASADNPLRLAFRLDGSLLPAGADASTLQVFRDGAAIGDCTGAAGTASPDPCVAQRSALAGGGVELTVLTSHASGWQFGLHVPYTFSGFFSPLSNSGYNAFAAGATVPVKFALGGNQGMRIFASRYPKSHRIDCTTGESLGDERSTSGRLTYDPTLDRYLYAWATSRSWSTATGGGPCRQLDVRLIDGTLHSAKFRFTRR